MKRLVIGLAIVSLLVIGAIAYAHGPGWWGGGSMMGPGYSGGHMMGMMGPMMGGGMMGHGRGMMGANDQEFFDETADLRKELHNKRFEYFESLRKPETPAETITKLEREIVKLQEEVYKKAPRTGYGMYGRYGCMW